MFSRMLGSALALALSACWHAGATGDDGAGDGDGGDSDQETGGGDTWEEVGCTDLSPCVESSVSGFTCPGAVTGVICWDFGSRCEAVYLCASLSQACALGCEAATCGASAGDPPHPVCD